VLAIAKGEDGGGGAAEAPTLIVAVPRLVGLALLVAVRRIAVVELKLGAVNKPVAVTFPADTDHVTPEFLVLDTIAAN